MTEKPSELDSEEVRKRKLVSQLLKKYRQIIFIDEKSATKTDLVQCKLWMKHDIPIRTKLRPLGHNAREWLRNEIKELLKAEVIRPSRSPYRNQKYIYRGQVTKKFFTMSCTQRFFIRVVRKIDI